MLLSDQTESTVYTLPGAPYLSHHVSENFLKSAVKAANSLQAGLTFFPFLPNFSITFKLKKRELLAKQT